jgi:cysteine desulfurase
VTRHYLDHASTSPLRPGVLDAMLPWIDAADPGRVHTEGRMARVAIEEAREQVAAFFGARPREVVFTSGATESINAAVWGAAQRTPGGVFVLTGVEHSAVREASAHHQSALAAVDATGLIDVGSVAEALDQAERGGAPVALVHCQWANHEVGTIQPVEEVVALARERGALVHVDAAAAAGHAPVQFTADLMSVSAHKLGGPKGVGALLVRRGLRLDPLLVGGEQERARRGGLENVAGIVGFAAAVSSIDIQTVCMRERALTDRLRAGMRDTDSLYVYGPTDENADRRLVSLVCLGVEGVEAEAVLLGLDQAGIAAHSGSACSSESLEPSPVLQAMGVDAERSLRLSVGWSTAEADVDAVVDALPRVVERLRALRSGAGPRAPASPSRTPGSPPDRWW